jgi:uncharacterized membrane protein
VPKRSFTSATAAGGAETAAGVWATHRVSPLWETVRVERGIRIASSAVEVYSVFAQVKRLPQVIESLVGVHSRGDVSIWTAEIGGRRYEWDVEIVQVVPGQVIGWSSCRGPKHSGRISFLSLGDDTLVSVEVNYIPSAHLLGGGSSWKLGDLIGAALRDLKATLELASPPLSMVNSSWEPSSPAERATGT